MFTFFAPRRCILIGLAAVCACDGAEPVIDLDTRDRRPGEGEGEGESGEGEVGSCDAVKNASFGAAIALQVPRSRHSATRLIDGRVLLVGGEADDFLPTDAVEIVDVDAGTSESVAPLNEARYEHAAVLLGDGSVVVAGGFGAGHLASVERFDGAAWTVIGALDAPRAGLSGIALDDGRALFFGGDNTESIPTTMVVVDTDSVDVVAGASIGENRRLHAAVKLSSGQTLIAGGFFTSAIATTAIVDANGSGAVAGPALPGARRQAMAVALADGGALVVGGIGQGLLSDIQHMPPTLAGFISSGSLPAPRHSGEAVALGCGAVICGGLGDDGALDSCVGIDGDALAVPMGATLPEPMFSFTFTLLDNGRALVAGGSLPENHLGEARVLRLAD